MRLPVNLCAVTTLFAQMRSLNAFCGGWRVIHTPGSGYRAKKRGRTLFFFVRFKRVA